MTDLTPETESELPAPPFGRPIAEAWTTERIREAFIDDGGLAEYHDPINGARDHRRAAGAIFDAWLAAHDAEERHGGYRQLHELVKDAPEGVRRAVGNTPQRVLANGSFSLPPSTLLHLLTAAYERGRYDA